MSLKRSEYSCGGSMLPIIASELPLLWFKFKLQLYPGRCPNYQQLLMTFLLEYQHKRWV